VAARLAEAHPVGVEREETIEDGARSQAPKHCFSVPTWLLSMTDLSVPSAPHPEPEDCS
jgi:hypothetical protein